MAVKRTDQNLVPNCPGRRVGSPYDYRWGPRIYQGPPGIPSVPGLGMKACLDKKHACPMYRNGTGVRAGFWAGTGRTVRIIG